MPVAIDISFDPRQLRDMRRLLVEVPLGLEKALSRAINKIGVAARVRLMRMITRAIQITQRELRGRNIRFRKASFSKLFAVLSVVGGRIPLIHFGARQTKRGVTYKIKRGGRRQRVDSAFIQTLGSGHKGVFARSGTPRISRAPAQRTSKRKGQKKGMAFMTRPRLPIAELRGPSIPEVVRNAREFASGTMARLMGTRLAGEMETQTVLILKRHGKEAGLVPI